MKLEGAGLDAGAEVDLSRYDRNWWHQNADKIKTHHNRVPAIQQMIDEGRVIEPPKSSTKTKCASLGRDRFAHELVWRHPFRGSGLALEFYAPKAQRSN